MALPAHLPGFRYRRGDCHPFCDTLKCSSCRSIRSHLRCLWSPGSLLHHQPTGTGCLRARLNHNDPTHVLRLSLRHGEDIILSMPFTPMLSFPALSGDSPQEMAQTIQKALIGNWLTALCMSYPFFLDLFSLHINIAL